MTTSIIAAASYEGSLFTWNISAVDSDVKMEMTSGFHCAMGSVRAIALSKSGKYLVCGGSDERVRMFNMVDRRAIGELSMHTGAITCLDFYGDSYLLSGSEDNNVCIWRVHDWMCVHVLGGHKKSVTGVAVHPSGKLALSVSNDNTMKLWDLTQGRCAFTRRLKGSASAVRWSEDGSRYLLMVQRQVQIYAAEDNRCLATIDRPMRVNQAIFLATVPKEGDFAVICVSEDKSLALYSSHNEQICTVDMASVGGRLRDITTTFLPSELADVEVGAIVTSDGKLVLIDVQSMMEAAGQELQFESIVLGVNAIPAEPRLTCVTGVVLTAKSSKQAPVDAEIPTVSLPPHMMVKDSLLQEEEEEEKEEEIASTKVVEHSKKRKKIEIKSDKIEKIGTKKKMKKVKKSNH